MAATSHSAGYTGPGVRSACFRIGGRGLMLEVNENGRWRLREGNLKRYDAG